MNKGESISDYSLKSWRNFKTHHQPNYSSENIKDNQNVYEELKFVTSENEINDLKTKLEMVHLRKSFLIIAGDCAETFADATKEQIKLKIEAIKSIGDIITERTNKNTILVGRMAGQFFKPRSSPTELFRKTNETIDSYKGDGINDISPLKRDPDLSRLKEANSVSIRTIEMIKRISPKKEIFVSHDGMHLSYEESLTEHVSNGFLNRSAHLIWIGERTRQLNGGHLEFFRGILNPVGIKIGPNCDVETLISTCNKLNPSNLRQKLVLITRFSALRTREILPPLIKGINESNLNVIWQCDPMHGNTIVRKGYKTRLLKDIEKEIRETALIHKENGSFLGGLHLEMTGEYVTECIGLNVSEEDLPKKYLSRCDPRLNCEQGEHVAKCFSDAINNGI